MEMSDTDYEIQQVIFDALDRLGIEYDVIHHKPLFTMKDGLDIAEQLNVVPCKNLLLYNRQQQFYLVMSIGNKRLAIKEIANQIGSSHLSFANDEQLGELMNTRPGGVSPLGLLFDRKNKIQLLVDKDVLTLPNIGCHTCTNTCSIRLKSTDLFNIVLPYLSHSDYKTVNIG